MNPVINRKSTALWAAVAIAAIGGALAVRSLAPSRARPSPPRVELPPPSPPLFSLPISPEFETRYAPEEVPQLAARIREVVAPQVGNKAELAALGADMTSRLVSAVQEQMEIYLSGSFDRYMAFQARSGGRREFIEKAGPDPDAKANAQKTVQSVWEAMAKPIAGHPISMDELTLRLRFLNGKPFPSPDDKLALTIVTMPDRWPALAGEPSTNHYTIVEFLLPVFYVRESESSGALTAPVYFGIWFIWDPSARDWRIHQTRLYSPMRISNLVCPQF